MPAALLLRNNGSLSWTDGTADLTPWAGRKVTIRLWNGCGPANDPNYDRCLWGDAGIVGEDMKQADLFAANAAHEAKAVRPEQIRVFSLSLSPRGEAWTASFTPGPSGLLDGTVLFSDGERALSLSGFTCAIDDVTVGTGPLDTLAKYGVTNAVYVRHVWQRWGFDYRLPEIWPLDNRQPHGSQKVFLDLVATARRHGILFVPHDNYIDHYPDAAGFSYDDAVFDENGAPVKAWFNFNAGKMAQSYRWAPGAFMGARAGIVELAGRRCAFSECGGTVFVDGRPDRNDGTGPADTANATALADFAPLGIKTDGAFRLERDGDRALLLTPIPDMGRPFRVELDLAALAPPVATPLRDLRHPGRPGATPLRGCDAVSAVEPVEPAPGAALPTCRQEGAALCLSLDSRSFAYRIVF